VPAEHVSCCQSVLRGPGTGCTAVNCAGLAGFRARRQLWSVLFAYRDVTILYFPARQSSVQGLILQQGGSTARKRALASGKLFQGFLPFSFMLCCVSPLCCCIVIPERSFSLRAACCSTSLLPMSQELALKPPCTCAPLSLIPTLHPPPDRLSTPTLVSPLYENTSPAPLFSSWEPHTESRCHACRLSRPR